MKDRPHLRQTCSMGSWLIKCVTSYLPVSLLFPPRRRPKVSFMQIQGSRDRHQILTRSRFQDGAKMYSSGMTSPSNPTGNCAQHSAFQRTWTKPEASRVTVGTLLPPSREFRLGDGWFSCSRPWPRCFRRAAYVGPSGDRPAGFLPPPKIASRAREPFGGDFVCGGQSVPVQRFRVPNYRQKSGEIQVIRYLSD